MHALYDFVSLCRKFAIHLLTALKVFPNPCMTAFAPSPYSNVTLQRCNASDANQVCVCWFLNIQIEVAHPLPGVQVFTYTSSTSLPFASISAGGSVLNVAPPVGRIMPGVPFTSSPGVPHVGTLLSLHRTNCTVCTLVTLLMNCACILG